MILQTQFDIYKMIKYLFSYYNGDTHYPCTSQIDSPSTTNAVTYTVSGERRSGSGNMYFNHQGGHSDEAESNIVLLEVSA